MAALSLGTGTKGPHYVWMMLLIHSVTRGYRVWLCYETRLMLQFLTVYNTPAGETAMPCALDTASAYIVII